MYVPRGHDAELGSDYLDQHGRRHRKGQFPAAGFWSAAAGYAFSGVAAAVARLLDSLRAAGAEEQAAALLRRDPAADVSLDSPAAVADLLDELRWVAGAKEQATALAERLPGAGMFDLFYEQEGQQDRFRFGRNPDGSPAGPWGWDDLD